MNAEVKYFISNCAACNDYLRNSSKKQLISHFIPSKPWSQITMDIVTVFDRNFFFFSFLTDCFLDYGRLLLQILGIRHTAK